jgi:hypothetical protein
VVDPVTNAVYFLVAADLLEQLMGGEADGASTDDFPAVDTAEWGQTNRRRAELIRKKLRGELTEAERRQYEWLQRRSLEALDAAFPRPASGEAGPG